MSKGAIQDVSTAQRPARIDVTAPALVPALTIVSHPRVVRAGERVLLDALLAGRAVGLSRNAPDFAPPGRALGLPLGDPFISRQPIHLAPTADRGVRVLTGGPVALTSLGAPLPDGCEFRPQALAAGVPLELAGRVVLLLHLAPRPGTVELEVPGLVGASAGLRRVLGDIARVADLDLPVLIRGETGTGKELVAHAVHAGSARRDRPFVSVNVGALPRELAAAELFGAQRGAYTGSTRDREGYFGAARGGTLFLDEVGEAPPEVQVLLLRVLETGELYPVGSTTRVATDVRVLAATDADLDAQIRAGRFRAPLLHRLAGYEIRVPALRERREDIGPLFCHFAAQPLAALGEAGRLAREDPYADPWLPAALALRLLCHDWPGNIRQLQNVTRQLVIGSRGQAQLALDARLCAELAAPLGDPPREAAAPARRRKPSEVSEAELRDALRTSAWELKPAADRLGIPRSSIYDVLERFPAVRTAGDLRVEEITECFHRCSGDLAQMVECLEVSGQALKRRLRELGL